MEEQYQHLIDQTQKDLEKTLRRLLRKGQCGPEQDHYELYHAIADALVVIRRMHYADHQRAISEMMKKASA